MISRRCMTFAVISSLFCGAAAVAEESASTPLTKSGSTEVTSVTSETSTTTTAPTTDSQTTSVTSDTKTSTSTSQTSSVTPDTKTSTSTSQTTTAATSAVDPTALLYAEKVSPGAFESKRQLLLASIKLAKKQGFGVTVYLGELNKVEEQIKAGNASPQLEARIDSIADGLQDQLKRSQILKTQRPTGASPRTSYSGSSSSDSNRPRKSTDAMINELRQKYGDKIPAGLSGLDNNELKEKLMKSDVAKEYLRKLQGQ